MKKGTFWQAALLAALIIPCFPAIAQEKGPDFQKKMADKVRHSQMKDYFSFSFENDSIGGGSDSFYTSGVRATGSGKASGWNTMSP